MKSPLLPLGSAYIFAFVKLSLIVCLASLTTGFVPQVYVFLPINVLSQLQHLLLK
ncbi:hypothetical protein [Spiroplasma endosymbiont of Nomada rufipes]|uniref:hypothetical protein n=1 Tax=Spiroplasma endosymbiont of Nomada rufipes TaxID=3077933 RepID=UPI00376F08E6